MNRDAVLDRALGLQVNVHGLQQADAERGGVYSGREFLSIDLTREPVRRIAPAEVRHAPAGTEPGRADGGRIGRHADEARMRPRRGELYRRLGARGQHAQIATAVDVEVEVERHHGACRHGLEIDELRLHARREHSGVVDAWNKGDVPSVPVQRDAPRDAARIRNADVERRLVPERLDGPARNRAQIRPDESTRDFQVRAIDDNLEDAPLAQVGLHRADDVERFRKKGGPRDHLLRLSIAVRERAAVRHYEHRSPDRLRPAPGAADLLNDRIPPGRALAHDGLHHLQRDEQADEERRHYEQSRHRRCPQIHSVLHAGS